MREPSTNGATRIQRLRRFFGWGLGLWGLVPNVFGALWHQVEGRWLRVYYSEDRVAAERVARVGDALYEDIASRFELPVARQIDVWLTASPEQLEEIARAPIRDWAAGYAFPSEARIVLRNPSGRLEELDRLTRHEVAHVMLGFLVGGAATEVPLWFHEGFAMYVSEPWTWNHQLGLLGSALFRKLRPLDAYAQRFPLDAEGARIAYLQSFSAVRTLISAYSFTRFQTFLYRLNAGELFERAFEETYGLSLLMYRVEWAELATRGSEWLMLLGGSMVLGMGLVPFVWVGYFRFRRARAARLRALQELEEQPDPFFQERSPRP